MTIQLTFKNFYTGGILAINAMSGGKPRQGMPTKILKMLSSGLSVVAIYRLPPYEEVLPSS